MTTREIKRVNRPKETRCNKGNENEVEDGRRSLDSRLKKQNNNDKDQEIQVELNSEVYEDDYEDD